MIIFLSLLPIIFVNNIIKGNYKYTIYFIGFISYVTHILYLLYTEMKFCGFTIATQFLYSSAIISILIINYILFERHRVKILLHIGTLLVLVLSIYISYESAITRSNEKVKYENIERNNKEVEEYSNIEVGEILNNLLYFVAADYHLNNEKSLKYLLSIREKIVQKNIDTVSSNPKLFKKLVKYGYCRTWKMKNKLVKDKQNSTKFLNTESIDKQCKEINLIEKLENNETNRR